MLTVTCIVALISIVNAAETSRIKTVYDGHLMFQDVTIDADDNTMLIVVEDEDTKSDLKNTVNLHDFNAGYVAMKSVADGICLLKPLDQEGIEDHLPSNTLENVNGENVVKKLKPMYWNRDPHVMYYDEVVEQAGETLAEFCRDYKTYTLTPKEVDLDARALLSMQRCAVTKNEPNKDLRGFRLQKRGWCVVCFGCLNYVDVFESDVVDTGEKIDRK